MFDNHDQRYITYGSRTVRCFIIFYNAIPGDIRGSVFSYVVIFTYVWEEEGDDLERPSLCGGGFVRADYDADGEVAWDADDLGGASYRILPVFSEFFDSQKVLM